jgi:hypothetical protein
MTTMPMANHKSFDVYIMRADGFGCVYAKKVGEVAAYTANAALSKAVQSGNYGLAPMVGPTPPKGQQ